MRILFSVHLWPPQHSAGGELYCLNLAKFLLSKGHEVRVLHHDAKDYNIDQIYTYEGIDVFPPVDTTMGLFNWAELVITHLGYAPLTLTLCHDIVTPVIFISHNTWKYDSVVRNEWAGVIYNSYANAEILGYNNPSVVLRPVCDDKFFTKNDPRENEYITLISLNKNKGGKIFFNIAKALPERKFLAVKGAYDPQWLEDLPNVKIIENTPDIERVYARTRLLLVPSKYESWGMCATEAMAGGIPVIYNPTFGLLENVGEAGIQVKDNNPTYEDPDIGTNDNGIKWENPGLDPSNWKAWIKAIKSLDRPSEYQAMSRKARNRAKKFQEESKKELERVNEFILKIRQDHVSTFYQRHFQG